MGAGDPTELVQELVDSDQRLPGEKEAEGSELVEDAEHWWRVYLELLSFKRTLLYSGGDSPLQPPGSARRHNPPCL